MITEDPDYWLFVVKGPHEPIKRRLNTDTAARRFRKVLATVKWVCHALLFLDLPPKKWVWQCLS